jgi:hypothetical protein
MSRLGWNAKAISSASPPVALTLAFAGLVVVSSQAHAVDDACKQAMSARIKVCAEDCRQRALTATDIKDPNNNILFGCIKICAQNMALQMQVCR